MFNFNSAFCFVASFLLMAQSATAWNGHGHRIIASIAFQQLEPARRLELADRIRNHPRFDADFAAKIPDEVKTADDQMQAEWIFQQAACWPDRVRSLKGKESKQYHHPTWHYVNQVLYLRPEDEAAVDLPDLNLSTDPPDNHIEKMNVVQAIEFAKLRVSGEVETTPENDALMICWLLHCYADLHQPLHTTAMFSHSLLKTGCRGGNRIPTTQGRNLHSLWDGLLGKDNDFRECRNEAIEMRNDKIEFAIGRESIAMTGTIDVWKQSHELCSRFTYADEIRAHLIRLEDDGETKIAKLDLSKGYLRVAGRIAHFQATRAGWRLGEVLK
ncbi:S1/P1 nuclease [Mariniblastus sp.]|nr:S1/P1 nuclease [Mariniblastus sp.]